PRGREVVRGVRAGDGQGHHGALVVHPVAGVGQGQGGCLGDGEGRRGARYAAVSGGGGDVDGAVLAPGRGRDRHRHLGAGAAGGQEGEGAELERGTRPEAGPVDGQRERPAELRDRGRAQTGNHRQLDLDGAHVHDTANGGDTGEARAALVGGEAGGQGGVPG